MERLQPGFVVRAPFVFPEAKSQSRPAIIRCVVMAVHDKGILVLPMARDVSIRREWSVRIPIGPGLTSLYILCDRRNVIYGPERFLVAERNPNGDVRHAVGRIEADTFATLRERMLTCCDMGLMRDVVIRRLSDIWPTPGPDLYSPVAEAPGG